MYSKNVARSCRPSSPCSITHFQRGRRCFLGLLGVLSHVRERQVFFYSAQLAESIEARNRGYEQYFPFLIPCISGEAGPVMETCECLATFMTNFEAWQIKIIMLLSRPRPSHHVKS